MDKSYVVVIGTGVTSRANLEALIEDYFYAKGKDVYLALAFDKVPSQGQIFAAQYARDNNKEIVIFCQDGANLQPFPSASVSVTDEPIKSAIDLPDATVMLLWDDSDPLCLTASDYCASIHRRSYNLCQGLALITRETVGSVKPSEPDEPEESVKEDKPDLSDIPVTNELIEAMTAEIQKAVIKSVIAALQDVLKKL